MLDVGHRKIGEMRGRGEDGRRKRGARRGDLMLGREAKPSCPRGMG